MRRFMASGLARKPVAIHSDRRTSFCVHPWFPLFPSSLSEAKHGGSALWHIGEDVVALRPAVASGAAFHFGRLHLPIPPHEKQPVPSLRRRAGGLLDHSRDQKDNRDHGAPVTLDLFLHEHAAGREMALRSFRGFVSVMMDVGMNVRPVFCHRWPVVAHRRKLRPDRLRLFGQSRPSLGVGFRYGLSGRDGSIRADCCEGRDGDDDEGCFHRSAG